MSMDEKYSDNQSVMIIRVDDKEISVPINFGLTDEGIRKLYPHLREYANITVKSPAIQFAEDVKKGKYDALTDRDYDKLVTKMSLQSRFWYNKPEASLLDVAVRFTIDAVLRNVDELSDILNVPIVIDDIKAPSIQEDETRRIVNEMQLETATDYEFDPGNEQDVPLGVAGNLHVDIYDAGTDDDYLSEELDKLESKLDVHDKFEDIVNSELDESRYQSEYDPNAKLDEKRIQNGVLALDIYDETNTSEDIYNKMNELDGLVDDSSEAYEENGESDNDLDNAPDEVPEYDDDDIEEKSFDDDDNDIEDEDDEEGDDD